MVPSPCPRDWAPPTSSQSGDAPALPCTRLPAGRQSLTCRAWSPRPGSLMCRAWSPRPGAARWSPECRDGWGTGHALLPRPVGGRGCIQVALWHLAGLPVEVPDPAVACPAALTCRVRWDRTWRGEERDPRGTRPLPLPPGAAVRATCCCPGLSGVAVGPGTRCQARAGEAEALGWAASRRSLLSSSVWTVLERLAVTGPAWLNPTAVSP